MTLNEANAHDSTKLAVTLDAIPPVGSGRRRPGKLHADKAYDHRRCRQACRASGIVPRSARRGVDSRRRLGRHRWVVERTLAWLARFRRLAICYERCAGIHPAFTTLARARICRKQTHRLCP